MTTAIFNLPSSTSPDSKVHISHADIPQTYLDPAQPPVKRSPYRQINSHPFLRSVQICTSNSTYRSSSPASELPDRQFTYSKVILSLRDILDNEALRKGNHVLLSSPLDSSVRMSLHRGTLTVTMPQQIYQRSGLIFPSTKLQSGGRKHEKASALQRVEVDLRQPSMLKGRKGFDRLMYAAKNTDGLKKPRVWLHAGLDAQADLSRPSTTRKRKRDTSSPGQNQQGTSVSAGTATTISEIPESNRLDDQQQHTHILSKHHPTHICDSGIVSTFENVLIPPIFKTLSTLNDPSPAAPATILEEDMHEIIEYLSMLFLQSPQLTKQQYGKTDSYVSQYRLPDLFLPPGVSNGSTFPETTQSNESVNGFEIPFGTTLQDLNIITYEGLISSDWMIQLVVDLIRQSRSKTHQSSDHDWIVIKAVAHSLEPVGAKDGYMIVMQSEAASEDNHLASQDGMQADEQEKHDVAEQVETGSSKDGKTRTFLGGFRHVTCFEFVDSFT